MLKALPADLKVGDFVEWGQSQNNAVARGKVVDIRTDGEVNSSISGYTLTGTPDDPVYVIKLLQRDQQGNEVLTEQTVVHRASALRKIPDPIKSMKTMFGGELKAVGKGIVEGYLVRFGNPEDTDLEKDYFTKNTDFGIDFSNGDNHKLGLYYNHGLDNTLGTKKIGYGSVKMTNEGLWYQAQLNMADDYAKMIYELAQKGKLGFSSGAASHMVEREPMGKSYEIKRWALAEASLTPQPAESRNMVAAKSLKAAKEDLKVGDYVRWMAYGTDVRGKIEKVSTRGTLVGKPLGTRMQGTVDNPVYQVRVFQKQPDGSYAMDSATTVHRAEALTKIEKPKGKSMNVKDYMEKMEEHEEIEDMVEGLTKLNVDPMGIAASIFDGAEEDMFFDAMNCLTDKLRDGLIAIAEYGKPEDADALLEKFHMMALDLFNKMQLPQEMEMGEETMSMDMKNASSVRDVERILRDAGNLSRSQAKTLANLVWNSHRDVETNQEPEIKTTEIDNSEAELRKSLLEKAKKYQS